MSYSPAEQPVLKNDLEHRIREAQCGSAEALGQLFEGCRQYLLLVANKQLHADLRDKVAPSDLVQDTFLDAQRDFGKFHGHTEPELLAWLRRILLNNLTDTHRRYRGAGKRSVAREIPLTEAPRDEVRRHLARENDSPRTRLAAQEQAQSLRCAIKKMPEASQRVIEWRNYELCPFAEIGRRLGKSEEAARKTWSRAIEQLQRILESPHEPDGTAPSG